MTVRTDFNRALGQVEGKLEGLMLSVDRLSDMIEADRKAMHETIQAVSVAQRTLLENYNSLSSMVSRMQPHVEDYVAETMESRGRRKLVKTLHVVITSVVGVASGVAGAVLQLHFGGR